MPGVRATREAFSRKSVSPSECSTMPFAEVSSTMLWVLTIWSYSVSMTGAACWNRKRFSSRASVRMPREGLEKSGSLCSVMP